MSRRYRGEICCVERSKSFFTPSLNYHIRFNFRRVNISRMLALAIFAFIIFVDGHVLPLNKSQI